MLKLPRLISDGMVLQQKKKIHIWGWTEPGITVMAAILGREYAVTADEKGAFSAYLDELPPGGPYMMEIRNGAGDEIVLEDIWIGDVWICSGQSNMELMMDRVKDSYPEEIRSCENPAIRTFKITEHTAYDAPVADHLSGEWKAAREDTILAFSATAYFFARKMYELTGVPVGLINASLGGSRIESWMSREMLSGYDEFLELADRYADESFVQAQLLKNQEVSESWHGAVDAADKGLLEGWKNGIPAGEEESFKEMELPGFFKDTELSGFIGSVWFTRDFTVSEELAKRGGQVWLGTIVDSDTVYINGIKVGETGYQYPPRKYRIPQELLKEGKNTIAVRVKCENGHGRFTPGKGKEYAVWNEKERVSLEGVWKYRVGAACGQIGENDFVNWKPTGLYNGMMAPCHNYTVAGIIWYQGEANSWYPDSYRDLMERMIMGYRKNWNEAGLPFFYVQLPNFSGELYDIDRNGNTCSWAGLREAQRQAGSIPDTGMAVAIDLGEDNDLHPQNKKGVGTRLAMLAAKKLYGNRSECEGPYVDRIEVKCDREEKGEYLVTLFCKNCTGGLYAFSEEKGEEILDFEVLDAGGVSGRVKAEIAGDRVVLKCRALDSEPETVRYCYRNTNRGALLYNKEGFPMSPFLSGRKEKGYEAAME